MDNEAALKLIAETNERLNHSIQLSNGLARDLAETREMLSSANAYLTLLGHTLMWLMARDGNTELTFDIERDLVPLVKGPNQLYVDDSNQNVITYSIQSKENEHKKNSDLDFRPSDNGGANSGCTLSSLPRTGEANRQLNS